MIPSPMNKEADAGVAAGTGRTTGVTATRSINSNPRVFAGSTSSSADVNKTENSPIPMTQEEVNFEKTGDKFEGKPIPTFQCVLVGDSGTGKTIFLRRHLTDEFRKEYVATVKAEKYDLEFNTNRGRILFAVWDIPGTAIFEDLYKKHAIEAHAQCAIIMFSLTEPTTYENVLRWHGDIESINDDIPIVLCGNKVDIKDRKVKAETIFRRDFHSSYYDISAQNYYNFDEPFLCLARDLIGASKLKFVDKPASALPVDQPRYDFDPDQLRLIIKSFLVILLYSLNGFGLDLIMVDGGIHWVAEC